MNGITQPGGWEQSLSDGAPGVALAHIEQARQGVAGWGPVHHLAREMARVPVQAHPEIATLFYGAPAVAYALHTAGQPAYTRALARLDESIDTLVRARLDAAHRRIDRQQVAMAREYDLINGITGLGAYLIHRHEDGERLRGVLAYLVRLTQPIACGEELLPGWWAAGTPDRRRSPRWDGGHAGFGMAHGISGPLALLSIAMRRGVVVDGHHEAIHTICAWLDRWRAGHGRDQWWPEVIDRDEVRANRSSRTGPHRPSWCYGTPGIARAQQLAGLATGAHARAASAEQALVGCLTDERQLAHVIDPGLCHGWAGLVHIARSVHAESSSDASAVAIKAAARRSSRRLKAHPALDAEGLLEGAAGVALLEADGRPNWSTCLLTGTHLRHEGTG